MSVINKIKEYFQTFLSYPNKINNAILMVYLFFLIFTHFWGEWDKYLSNAFLFIYLLFVLVVLLALNYICPKILMLFKPLKVKLHKTEISKKERIGSIIFLFLLSFGILFYWYLAYYPGAFSSDTIYQYRQYLTGAYNDWKPILQTLITFSLPMKLTGRPESIIFFQILEYSCALTYMAYVILKYSNKIWAIFALLYILLNPVTGNILVYPWKDVTFALFCVLLMTFGFQIHVTDGKWLETSKIRFTIFSIVLAIATIVRHNAFLFTIPFLIAILTRINRKKRFHMLFIFIICISLVKGPISMVLEVDESWNHTTRVLGLPMSVLGNIAKEAPDSLDNDIEEFIFSVAPEKVWDELYECGSFNSVKWNCNQNVIEETGAIKILEMTVRASLKAPLPALKGMICLTDMIYTIGGDLNWNIRPVMADNDLGLAFHGICERDILEAYTNFSRESILKYIFWYIGIINLVICISFLSKCKFNEKKDINKILFVLPIVSYNFFTMLLISGNNDFRYFYLNFPIIPILLLILYGEIEELSIPRQEKHEVNENRVNVIKRIVNFIKEYRILFQVIAILICSWFMFQLSSIYNNSIELRRINIKYILLNIATNYAFLSVIYIAINSYWISCLIFSILTFLISIANYYTIQFHSTPLTLAEVGNLRTAINVIGEYRFQLGKIVPIIILFVLQCFLVYLIKKATKKHANKIKKIWLRNCCLCAISVLIILVGYLAPNSIVPELSYWKWTIPYQEYGYLPCTIKLAYSSLKPIKKPEGYSEGCVNNIKIKSKNLNKKQQPDVILILNETFYDLSVCVDIKTDAPYLENINSMENVIKGYAVYTGATNRSEYELLTSNSLKLMGGLIPFNILDMNNANSLVTHLKQIGYHTIGAHCADSANYNRGKAYVEMGFDEVYFKEDFKNITYFGNRGEATDESCYENVLSWLEQDAKTPQFIYLLTIQNHGGWDSNERNLDTVHAINDFGEYDEEVDEYLSCIQLSDLAFKKFTDQLQEIDRDIIVCMVGDHGPAFLNQISTDSNSSYLSRNRVPFVIWTNYDIEDEENLEGQTFSMLYLVPAFLNLAQINLSPYYEYMLDLKNEVPIITPYQCYYDKLGNEYQYDSFSDYTEMLNNYFYLEYNSLQKNRQQNLFDAY